MTDEKALARAKALAFRYLALRPRSRAEVAAYLKKKDIPGEFSEQVVRLLSSYGYIDDKKFASGYARHLVESKGLSRYALRFELKKKGVPDTDIELALDNASVEDEEAVALRVAKKKIASLKNVDKEKTRRRLTDHLRRKGYSFEVIMRVLKFLAVFAFFVISGCGMVGYGPVEDHSRFVSAKLVGDGSTVLFTAHRLVYRPAAGWRAFPDGGMPHYVTDENIIGAYDFAAGKPRILYRKKNTEWLDGQGEFFVSHTKGRTAIVGESGQRRSDYLTDYRICMLDINTGALTPLALKEELASRGRDLRYFYLLDETGTLLFVTPPLEASNNRVDPNAAAELWLRSPSGVYIKVGTDVVYEGYKNGEIIYWSPGNRSLYAYNAGTGATQRGVTYIPEIGRDARYDLRISDSGKKTLELWEKSDDGWRYKERLLDMKDIY